MPFLSLEEGRPMPIVKHLSRAMIALVAVCIAYGLSSLLRMNHFAWTLLKDRYYQYVSLFLPLLAIWCCAYLFIRSGKSIGFTQSSIAGLIGGYLCGLLAFVLLPIYGSQPAQRIFTTRDLSDVLFLSPLMTLSWAIGMIAAWIMWGIKTRFL